jgi:hypothetical protein
MIKYKCVGKIRFLMDSAKTLYDLLIEMEEAASRGDKGEVVRVRALFSPEYNRIMPERYSAGSVPDLYDMARNKLINSVDEIFFPDVQERLDELGKARELIARIPKPY